MLSSRRTSRIVSAVVIAVSFAATSCFCEVVWRKSVESKAAPLFAACTTQLEEVDGELSRVEYAELVENLSAQFVQGPFERLPLKYKSLFHAHACMDGRECVGNQASINAADKEGRRLTCSSLASQISESMPDVVTGNEAIAGFNNDTLEQSCTASGLESGTACVGKREEL